MIKNRQLKKEQTRELLIDAAYQVFSQRGVMGTRMSDIAQAAGVSHGTVFVHFQDQENLIEEVLGAYGQKFAQRTHVLADSCNDMEELLRAHLTGIMECEPFYTRLVIENRLLPAGARDAWIGVQSAISFHFSQAYERGTGQNKYVDIPANLLFNMWMGLVHYYLANGDIFAPEGNVIKRYGETLISNFIILLKGENEKNG